MVVKFDVSCVLSINGHPDEKGWSYYDRKDYQKILTSYYDRKQLKINLRSNSIVKSIKINAHRNTIELRSFKV